jgi:uncharacterized membrane protein
MERLWEIDFFRGIAILLMILFNWSFTLYYLGIYKIAEGDIYWQLFPRMVASMFIIIAGIMLSINNAKGKSQTKRGLKIFLLGIGITIVTWIFVPRDFIVFGILHFIGLSVIISPLFVKLKNDLLLAGALIIMIAGAILETFTFGFPWLVWFGFVPSGFQTLDYFPLLPWLGVMMLGVYIGNMMYEKGKRQIKIVKHPSLTAPFSFLGRHSLLIYIIHQPILLAILFAAGLL